MRSRGFSLLEVIVALTIMSMVLTVVFHGMSASISSITRIEESDRRLTLARSKLAELDLCGPIRAGDNAAGTFEDGTRWRVETSNFIEPTLTNPSSVVGINLKLEWEGRSGTQRRELKTYRFVPPQVNRTIRSLEDQLRDLR